MGVRDHPPGQTDNVSNLSPIRSNFWIKSCICILLFRLNQIFVKCCLPVLSSNLHTGTLVAVLRGESEGRGMEMWMGSDTWTSVLLGPVSWAHIAARAVSSTQLLLIPESRQTVIPKNGFNSNRPLLQAIVYCSILCNDEWLKWGGKSLGNARLMGNSMEGVQINSPVELFSKARG